MCILTLAGVLFGFDAALYSIIFQFCSTQVIQMLYKRYQKDTLLIITSKPREVYEQIRISTHHDATLIEGEGCFEEAPRGEVDRLMQEIRVIDEKAFINVIQTEQVNGRFYRQPTR